MILILALVMLAAVASPDKGASDADTFIKRDLHLTRYKAASVDLNNDGVPEILVYANGPGNCGSGGCDLYLLAKIQAEYRLVSAISVTRLPIRILPTSSNGWHDLGVQVAGGGIIRGYEARLRFDGKTYPLNPTVSPAKPLAKITGRIALE